jgi:thiol:disulfide interchange protein DsbC
MLAAWLAVVSTRTSAAPESDTARVTAAVRRALPGTTVSEVRAAPIPGLLEVVAGRNVFYTDAGGRFLVIGSIYDLATAQDLTAQRKREITRIVWQQLPLDKAIRIGSGPHKLAVFLDPDCPWCRKLAAALHTLENVEVSVFLFPIEALHPGVQEKSLRILCAANPVAALDRALRGEAVAETKHCADAAPRIDTVMRFAQAHGIAGTPTLVAADGRVHSGYLAPEALRTWLTATTQATKSPSPKKEQQ